MTWGGRAGDKIRARVFREETHCWLCNEWVDQTLPRTHPMSRTADHVHERAMGGPAFDRDNCRLAHRSCNTRKSNALRNRGPGVVSLSVNDL